MSNFGLDNAGAGFNLDDDDDLESMLGRAASASEDDDGDTHDNNSPDIDFQLEDDDDDFIDVSQQAEAPPIESPEIASVKNADDTTKKNEEIKLVEEVEPQVDQNVVVEAPIEKTAVKNTPKGKVKVPNEADQIADTLKVINILDMYRNLSAEEKTVAIQFVTNGELDAADDATLVVRVLNADPMLTATMRALRESHECEPVERAFYAMSLDSKTLHALGALVSVFSNEEYDEILPNLSFSRQVVAGIAQLGNREISFVRATESVLSAAETVAD